LRVIAPVKRGVHRVEMVLSEFRFTAKVSETEPMSFIRKLILILGAGAALILAGCNKGGTSDQYTTSSGSANSTNAVQNGGK